MPARAGIKFQTCLISLGCRQLLRSSSLSSWRARWSDLNVTHKTIKHMPRQSKCALDEGEVNGDVVWEHIRGLLEGSQVV